MMSFTGHIQNGMVVFDTPVSLPDGTCVEITLLTQHNQPTHFDRFKEIIGAAVGLPKDFAENHDHYIHGTPKE
jgi:hypothetical protein